MSGSPFLDVPRAEWLGENRSAFAIFDAYPVTEGHVLVVPHRRIVTWWEASADEQRDLLELVAVVKKGLDERYSPDGYNVGFDVGTAAGQTVEHLHVHVIPRYDGDVPDPRGGIRHVIPGKGNYLAETPASMHGLPAGASARATHAPELLDASQPEGRLRLELVRALATEEFDRIDLVVSFIMRSGLGLVLPRLETAIHRGGRVRILTTDYLDITDPDALTDLLDLQETSADPEVPGTAQIRVWHDDHGLSFHPKAYLFGSTTLAVARAFVGSSNLSKSGIDGGIEWNLSVSHIDALLQGFDRLWDDPRARPLTHEFLKRYRANRKVDRTQREVPTIAEPIEPPRQPVAPTGTQREALDALEATRIAGYKAGLVVMATGLGKTWLAAFDSSRPAVRRTLFVAHREEILSQSRDVFRQVRPGAELGLYYGKEKAPDADVVFASVQTLQRRLNEFAPQDFDYVVVDEFHHAAAQTYRRIIEHFSPGFLLGLTATPERLDGADLLALCADNLVYRCDLVDGIRRDELVPFRYWGLKDVADYAPIPWRNGKFDPDQLAAAFETQARAEQTVDAWREHGGGPTLAFCTSITHADFMTRWFADEGITALAVHSGPTSAPRKDAIERLRTGEIDVIFTVDVFNEGLDVPEIRTVLMLRPTESPVIFLQQLGRGLRRWVGKDALHVVDFIGNHHSFLAKPRVLLSLGGPAAPTNQQVLNAARTGEFALPEGCSVEYELEAIDLLATMATQGRPDALADYCVDYFESHGVRPSAVQAFRAGRNPGAARRTQGSWFALLADLGMLSDDERAVLDAFGAQLDQVERENITKSYKLVTLQALHQVGGLRDRVAIDAVAAVSHTVVQRDPRLVEDVRGKELPDPANVDPLVWRRFWRKWPIEHLANDKAGALFRIEGDDLVPTYRLDDRLADTFEALVAELVDWRLAQYLLRRPVSDNDGIRCRVSHSRGNPILFLDRDKNPQLPEGWTEVLVGGEILRLNFVQVAVNVAERPGEKGNALHDLLRGWFGPSAGLPGTNNTVVLEPTEQGWSMRPVVTAAAVTGANVVPLYPTYEVACGAFEHPQTIASATTIRLLPVPELPPLEPTTHFVAFASGDSMDGGTNPIAHGDPLLFAWARNTGREDLVGERVLVQQMIDGTHASVLKRLQRTNGAWQLESDRPGQTSIAGASDMRIAARLVDKLDQRAINRLTGQIGEVHTREHVPTFFADEYNFGKWGQSGHVSVDTNEVFFVTLNKEGMSTGAEYVDHFDGPSRFIWSSQNQTAPETNKGKAVLESPGNGRQVHLWVRAAARIPFTYCGLLIPLSHTGAKPMSVTFRLMTPLTEELQHRLQI